MTLNYGLIGNCTYSALVRNGAVEWLCWPRMDSSFVFGHLLDDAQGGIFAVESVAPAEVEQGYLENTNVLRTVFRTRESAFELLDFAPRFREYRRGFKPTMLVRIMRPLEGEPLLRVRCRPTWDYGTIRPSRWLASNHIQFLGLPAPLRLTTDVPLTYVDEERPFVLDRDRHLVLTWGQPLEAPLVETAKRFLERTIEYWRQWVKNGRVPRDYQREVIRSALVLKLHQFEDTGAILASTTTSIPEHPGSGRNWDYRYCWLRDAYFSLQAFELMGFTEEMESFLLYLRNICEAYGGNLQPVYAVSGEAQLEERLLPHLRGFGGDGPVRVGNQAYVQPQLDVYGEMILAVGRMLLDVRFSEHETRAGARRVVEKLLGQIERRLEDPDAGPWELRGRRQVHTFTQLMHWAGASRTIEIADHLGLGDVAGRARRIAARARELIETRCWDGGRGVLVQAPGSKDVDASSLLAVLFGFWPADDARTRSHVAAIGRLLAVDGGLLRRYDGADDFGTMQAAFTVCTFWHAQALGCIGRLDEGRALFERLLGMHNGMGLYAEDILPATGEQGGNFPQAYSHVGLINTAFQLSRPWT